MSIRESENKRKVSAEEGFWWNQMETEGKSSASSLPNIGGGRQSLPVNQVGYQQQQMQPQNVAPQNWQTQGSQPQVPNMGQVPMQGTQQWQPNGVQDNMPQQPQMLAGQFGGMGQPVQQNYGQQSQVSPIQNQYGQFQGQMPNMGQTPVVGAPRPIMLQDAQFQGQMPNQNDVSGSTGNENGKAKKPFVMPEIPVRKIAIGTTVVALVVALGTGVAFALPKLQDSLVSGEQPGQEQVADGNDTAGEQKDAPSNIYVTVSADGADANTTDAGVIVFKGDSGEDVALNTSTTKIGARTLLGTLDAGQYRLHVQTVPTNKDGSSYSFPFFDSSFEVKGDGSDVDVSLTLDKAVEKDDTKASDDSADNGDGADGSVDAKDDDKADAKVDNKSDKTDKDKSKKKKDNKSKSENSSTETVANNSSASPTKPTQTTKQTTTKTKSQHKHTWKQVTKTVHHKAKYRTVKHDAVKSRVTICDDCGQDITGAYSSHKASTGHSGYHYENKVTRKAYTEKVLVSKAYDEKKVTGFKCTTCGEARKR